MSFVTNLVLQAEDYIKQQIAAADIAGKLASVEDDVLSAIDNGVTAVADAVHGVVDDELANNVLALKIAEMIQGQPSGKFKALGGGKPRLQIRFIRRGLARRTQKAKGISLGNAVSLVNQKFPETEEGDAALLAEAQKNGVGAVGDGGFIQWLKDHLPQILAFIEKLLPLILAL